MRFQKQILLSLVLSSSAAFAQAKIDFSVYEGPPQIQTGTGGAKVTKNGIDYWTMGTPPRRYQIIGAIQDKRDETWDGGQAVGSPTVAKKVKKAGGNAVIVQSQDEKGNSGSAGSGILNGLFLGGGSKTITVMLVVKYLPEEQAAITPTEGQRSVPKKD